MLMQSSADPTPILLGTFRPCSLTTYSAIGCESGHVDAVID
jgi:hypothetical protein